MDITKRPNKEDYYLDIALAVARRGTCLRRRYGAVIVNNDEIVATGYTGAPRGTENCCDIGTCLRAEMNVPRGTRYELCRSVHAEQNAIISAARGELQGAVMYVSGFEVETGEIVSNIDSCAMCKRVIINSGIDKVLFRNPSVPDGYTVAYVKDWVENEKETRTQAGY